MFIQKVSSQLSVHQQLKNKINFTNQKPTIKQKVEIWEILKYHANTITHFRFILVLLACSTFLSSPMFAGYVIILSVILDYVDGIIARKYNQQSFYGFMIDWITDAVSETALYLFWISLDATYLPIFFFFLTVTYGTMLFDVVLAATDRKILIDQKKVNRPFFVILKWTFIVGNKGYSCNYGLGYPLTINYALWTAFNSFSLIEPNVFAYKLMVYGNFIPAMLYIWQTLAYGLMCIESWEEIKQRKMKIQRVQQ